MRQKISLIVQPGDSFFPIVRAIDRAHRSINLTAFRMDDPIIQRALIEARQRGVRIRVLISSSARGWADRNRKLLRDASEAGIDTREPPGDSKRARYHYKVMTVDDEEAFVFTFNPTRENLHYTRDFGVELFNPTIAAEINRLFDADWDDRPFVPDAHSPLLVSPFNSRQKIEGWLAAAERSIQIADAKVQDPAIVRLLVHKAASGIPVRVLGDEAHGNGLPAEIAFRAVPRYKLHAKCTIVDGSTAVIGSMNLRTESLDRRRELGIMVDDGDVLQRLQAVFESDWERKLPMFDTTATQVMRLAEPPGRAATEFSGAGFILLSRTSALVRHAVREGVTTIGRAPENDVVISDALVSRYHAHITREMQICRITDRGSGNGTFVNGDRIIGTTALRPGDVIRIADSEEFRLLEL
ncbi:phospholipase D-like domain-containing protein [Accumulibacter sp.]|jgi:cardiolipin synthase|uniref:phospholipase D n=2 Tax=Candidatus Accumulibacter TaxID=327159 RepID=C7RSL3_ACCRE|nr:phospholipase D-like domain-containing protein [Accumulibacter sp.]MBN8495536.1 FHA domain-containing protein [Accumulibacter sp.]MBO3715899.1 FHA domain-containing protein [Accumulibacter sp.]